MRIPVLCYHSQIITGNDYRGNGHIALAADLALFCRLGWQVVSLDQVCAWHRSEYTDTDSERWLALSFDDGMASDFGPIQHPRFGPQPGFLPILEAFHQGPLGADQPQLHATSFVIASAQARRDIDRRCHGAIGWDHSPHWQRVRQHPLLRLENHSWDHNHEACNEAPGYPQGTFRSIHNRELCEHEVSRASDFLQHYCGQAPRYFAYPYGEYHPYLSETFLPQRGPELGLHAAFTTAGRYLERTDSCWQLPRFVHGWHWQSEQELAQLLAAA